MQSVSSRIWTRVAGSTSYDDSHYTTGYVKHEQSVFQISQDCFGEAFVYLGVYMSP